MTAAALEVLRSGILTLVQDLGRPGHGATGVGRSGAADRGSLRRANVAAGNPPGAAALEVLLGGLVVRARGPLVLALAGAELPITVQGAPVGGAAADGSRDGAAAIVVSVPDGGTVRLGTARTGLRGYLAVRGGLAVPTVLGSAATDTLSGIGPAPVAAGDVLPIGRGAGPGVAPDPPGRDPLPSGTPLEVVRGPRQDWFADPEALTSTAWSVSPQSDRVGIRLTGGVLERSGTHRGRELPSEAMVPGALQVPPDGAPVLLMADHPVTGGYPVIGVLTDDAIDRAAQLRPGAPVRFRFLP